MSIETIGKEIWGNDDSIDPKERTDRAQQILDAVMKGFPHLRDAITDAQAKATKLGYTETILGRRRHHPKMQLPDFEFKAMHGYVNPDIDPLDASTLNNKSEIPDRIVKKLEAEFSKFKYKGQIWNRTKALAEEKIKVIDNRSAKEEASRKVWNAVIQGSAAELTKMAMIKLTTNPEWLAIGGRFLIPVHDELIVEVPFEHRAEGARILKESMEQAGSFLPFTISCDIEETFRWYGLAVDDVLSFDAPTNMDRSTYSESNIKWIQCRLIESEYQLPVYKNEDGSKPIGLAAKGVNGKWSDEMDQAISHYLNRYNIVAEDFISHIDNKVCGYSTMQ